MSVGNAGLSVSLSKNAHSCLPPDTFSRNILTPGDGIPPAGADCASSQLVMPITPGSCPGGAFQQISKQASTGSSQCEKAGPPTPDGIKIFPFFKG